MDFLVEGTLEWAPLSVDDLPQLAELRQAIEYFDDPVERQDLEELYEQFTARGEQVSMDAVVGRDRGGAIVAYGWNHPDGLAEREPRVWMDGGVHPAWRHKQIGRRLVEWQVERAREWYQEACLADPALNAPLWVGAHIDERQVGAGRLLAHAGFEPVRWYFDMHAPFAREDGSPLPVGAIADLGGVQLLPFHPELSEQVRQAHNEAFSETKGTHRVGKQVWEESLSREAARPEWSWVAVEDGEVVGYALNSAYAADWEQQGASEGWTDRLGVRPAWRRRGIGTALLQASMRSFRDAGLQGAGLGIDSDTPDGAAASFERVGYVRDEMVVLHVREFPREGPTR